MNASKDHRRLSVRELNDLVNKEKQVCLIDVLGSEHFQLVHLPGSSNACVYEVTFIDQVRAITEDKNTRIVLYGSSGNSMDSVKAAEKLLNEGYKDVLILEGGIEAWRSAGNPLEGNNIHENIDPYTHLRPLNENRKYKIDREQSILQWTGRNQNSIHVGVLKIAKGEFTVKNEKFSGEFKIDMDSIINFDLEGDELQPVLISHLKSDDFFLTKLFPNATFEILDARPVNEPFLGSPNFKIKGSLTLRGMKLDQDFMATVTEIHPNGVVAEAHFDIDRTRWGVIYGSARFFEHLGMHLVFDMISIQTKIIAYC